MTGETYSRMPSDPLATVRTMLNRLRPRITYANVVSSLCLFILLGGAAYAASLPKNSVGTKQLKADAVKSGKVKNGTLKREDLKAGQFATPAQLTTVDAAKLGGIAPGGFLQGAGHEVFTNYDITANDDSVLALPDGGAIAVRCSTSGYNPFFRSTSGEFDLFQFAWINGNSSPNVQTRNVTSESNLVFVPIKNDSIFEIDVQGTGGGAAVTVWGSFNNTTKHCTGRVRGLSFP
jgi:hypothetical protein